LMKKLDSMVPAGLLYGPGNPNNWGFKDQLEAIEKEAGNPTPEKVTRECFVQLARFHAQYWKDETLLQRSWLRCSDWFDGRGEESWSGAMKMAQDGMEAIRKDVELGTSGVKWDLHLLQCLEAAFRKVSWEQYRADIKNNSWTLVQGDCHPGNVMWPSNGKGKAVLIDFEMAGLGSPGQELGQFVISHMNPDTRRTCEKACVECYHKQLTEDLRSRKLDKEADSYTFETCWSEYVFGGVGRWSWFLPYFAGNKFPTPVTQFFHDQLAEFLKDHVTDPESVGQPRV